MRNLKKVLSLSLALVMLLGMMVVGAGAVETSFKDDSEIGEDYKEAVAVMSALGIINGTDNNNFAPKGTLTRGQAAKIVCYMTMGKSTADALGKISTSEQFTDSNGWYAGFVDACASLGYVDGVGDNKFDPEGTLTGTAFAKMLLTALEVEGVFTGPEWEKNVRLACIRSKLPVPSSEPISRELASYTALEGMKYTEKGTLTGKYIITPDDSLSDADDATLVAATGGVKFESRLEAVSYMNALNLQKGDSSDYALGTDYSITAETDDSGSLLKDVYGVTFNEADKDEFGNTVRSYTDASGVLVSVPVGTTLEYTGKVTYSKVYNDLGLSKASDASYIVDGAAATTISLAKSTTNQSVGANGATTNVFKNGNKITIVTMNSYLAKVTKVNPAKAATSTADAVKANVVLTVYGLNAGGANVTGKTINTEDFAKDDIVVVTVSKNGKNTVADWTVESIEAIEPIEGKVTAKNATSGTITVDGEKYTVGAKNTGSAGLKLDASDVDFTTTYSFYIKNDAILGGEVAQAAVSTDYVYVKAIDMKVAGTSMTSGGSAQVKADAIFADGTHKVIDLKVFKKSGNDTVKAPAYSSGFTSGTIATITDLTVVNTSTDKDVKCWYAYTVDDDGYYTLQTLSSDYAAMAPTGSQNLTKGQPKTFGGKYTTASTEITVVKASDYTVGKATGLVKVDMDGTDHAILYTYSKGGKSINAIFAVEQSSVTIATQDYAYALSSGDAVDGATNWTFGYMGETATKSVKDGSPVKGHIYTLSDDSKGLTTVTEVAAANVSRLVKVTSVEDGYFVTDDGTVYLAPAARVFDVSSEAGEKGEATELTTDVYVKIVHDNGSPKTADTVFIVDGPAVVGSDETEMDDTTKIVTVEPAANTAFTVANADNKVTVKYPDGTTTARTDWGDNTTVGVIYQAVDASQDHVFTLYKDGTQVGTGTLANANISTVGEWHIFYTNDATTAGEYTWTITCNGATVAEGSFIVD